jgi:hypothetical protein
MSYRRTTRVAISQHSNAMLDLLYVHHCTIGSTRYVLGLQTPSKRLHGGEFPLFYLQEPITRQLAIIIVDGHRTRDNEANSTHGTLAEAPKGDYLHTRVARGWHVLWELANSSRNVHDSCTGLLSPSSIELAQETMQSSQVTLDAYKLKEDVVEQ